jgi:hypothetical protein
LHAARRIGTEQAGIGRSQVCGHDADQWIKWFLTDGEPITRTEVEMKKFWMYRAATAIVGITTLAVSAGAANKFAIGIHLFGL